MVVDAQTDLLEVVLTTHAAGRLARLLHRREQERHEHTDDCNDHEELHEREAHTPRASRIRDAHSRLPLRQMQREEPFARTQFANLERIIAFPWQNVTAKIAD